MNHLGGMVGMDYDEWLHRAPYLWPTLVYLTCAKPPKNKEI